jgi:hypothetical protein
LVALRAFASSRLITPENLSDLNKPMTEKWGTEKWMELDAGVAGVADRRARSTDVE